MHQIEIEGSNTIPVVVTPVLFKNTVLTFTAQNVKSLFSEFGTSSKFTADIETGEASLSETKSVTEFTFSGTKGYRYIECDGFGADASLVVLQGDVIQFNDDTGRLNKVTVEHATIPRGTDKSRIYINTALPDDVTAKSVVRLRPTIANGRETIGFNSNIISAQNLSCLINL